MSGSPRTMCDSHDPHQDRDLHTCRSVDPGPTRAYPPCLIATDQLRSRTGHPGREFLTVFVSKEETRLGTKNGWDQPRRIFAIGVIKGGFPCRALAFDRPTSPNSSARNHRLPVPTLQKKTVFTNELGAL
jgi:hypothetical protein